MLTLSPDLILVIATGITDLVVSEWREQLSWPYLFLFLRNGYGISTLRLFGLFEESGSDFQGFHLLLQNRQLSFFFS
jgi:hypothetical protein